MIMSEGAVHGSVRLWLRLEGVAAFLLATFLYGREDGSWLLFAALFFVPDISFAGYVAGPRVGAACYNSAHSYVGPALLAAISLSAGTTGRLAMVWGDSTSFGDTHLGRIGRRPAQTRR
jgi:hypothetical protein